MTARRRRRAAPASLYAALRGLLDRCLAAYAESAWVYRYGPGFAPTAPVRFAAAPAAPALRVQTLGTAPPAGPQPSGFRQPGRGRGQTAASRSPAGASA